MSNLTTLLTTLISANHILHYHNVVDAYGHISLRSNTNASEFYLSGNRAPALVSNASDLVTYHVSDASPLPSEAPKGYIERYIHSEILKHFPDVNCVIHAHAPDVLPYATSGVPLRPVFHMPGFLGIDVPVWDIENVYNDTDVHDLLVRNVQQGASLAEAFATSENSSTIPHRKVVLMRQHGFTTWGTTIEEAVFRAVFTTVNAQVQTNSMLLRNAFSGLAAQDIDLAAWGVGDGDQMFRNDFVPLTQQQAQDTDVSIGATSARPWELWVAEVEASPLYVNNGALGGSPS